MALVPGQRWISNAEPELGLGTVLRVAGRGVQMLFATAGVIRQYALHAAPLARAEFRIGQRVSGKGRGFVIERITETDGLLVYHGNGIALSESELDDTQSVSRADERLLSGRVDRPAHFDLRLEALERRAAALRSPVFGLAAARIDLIAHQLRVAEAATAQRPPRVLLADEVGLGKTIEAGMILARLLATGRAARVLVLVPESLTHQWFVELLRRFNLPFALFDEERCEAIELEGDARNPFEDEQLVIASLGFLVANPKRAAQALAASWDIAVVDEAHHLAWTPDEASPEYVLVGQFAAQTPGLVLLTATPEQLGRSGHFARLRLLDAARFHDLDRYIAEAQGYVGLSRIADRLQSGATLGAGEREELATRLADDPQSEALLDRYGNGDGKAAGALLDALIDRHGTGRVMFRNRRVQVGGFSVREPHVVVRDGSLLDDAHRQRLLAEFHADVQGASAATDIDYADDPRLPWLLGLLERHAGDKLLLICTTQAKVLALEEALRTKSGAGVARFHEGMSLIQRDRNAAWFAEADGARLLLCSEIGSEGRNFQFAHHLVLWDLPLDPDLLEQRIGRLDRIGQKHAIAIHAGAFTGTAQHVLLRWFDEGLDALRASPSDGRELLKRFGVRLIELAEQHAQAAEDADAEIDGLIGETRAAHVELSALVHAGRDRLLELAGERQASAQILRPALIAADSDTTFDEFVLRLFEHFGIDNEDHGTRSHLLDPEHVSVEGFPGLRDGARRVTFDRATALAREDLPLLRPDHPMVQGALDLLIESELGNAAFLVDDALAPRTVILQCVFLLECVADRRLGTGRFLPPQPLVIALDSKLAPSNDYRASPAALARAGDREIEFARYRPLLTRLVPPMLDRAETLARAAAQEAITRALDAAESELGAEHARLVALARVNPAVRQDEIDALAAELDALREALPQAVPRLDSLRFVCSADFLALR
ncbi:MAG TPA: RNA polymerase-associated protein RapA [Rhodanobacteraceae bacterium]|nr:RNA polymerase-associated protein RapA [Rhodanobacteraceae bacterium]